MENLNLRIQTQKGILGSDWQYLTQWKERVFPEEGRGKLWFPVTWHTIAYSKEGDPIGHIGFDEFKVQVDSIQQSVVGVGGVVVRPEYQGRGIPAQLFKEVHSQAVKSLGAEVFALFCPARLVPFYKKQGYQRHEDPVYFMQRDEKVLSTFEYMHRGNIATHGVVELQGHPW